MIKNIRKEIILCDFYTRNNDIHVKHIFYKKKKPAAFYFLRSLRSLPTFCYAYGSAKVAAGRRVRVRPCTRLQTQEKCLLLEICIQLNKKKPAATYFPAIAVSSALESLTSVFGMGTGITSPLWPPAFYYQFF